MKLILARHTQTDWNLAGRIQGQTDIELNAKGREDASHLAKSLASLHIDLIVSSDLKRAKETAQIMSGILSVPLVIEPRLRECSFGRVEGLTKAQAVAKYGSDILPDWGDEYDKYDFRPYGGEQRADVSTRHHQIIEQLQEDYSNKTIALVGHGRGLCTLLADIGENPVLNPGEYRVVNI